MAVELDLLNHVWKRTEKEQNFSRYNRAIKSARPFSLDDAAVEMIAEMSSGKNFKRMTPVYREMARLPFPIMWIEFDFMVLHRYRWSPGTTFPPGTDIDEIMKDIDSPEWNGEGSRTQWGKPSRYGFLLDDLAMAPGSFRVTTFGLMASPPGVEGYDPVPKAHVFPLVSNVTTNHIEKPIIFQPHPNTTPQEFIDMTNQINAESIAPGMLWGMDRDVTKENWQESPMFGTSGLEVEPLFMMHAIEKRSHHENIGNAVATAHAMLFSAAHEMKGDLRFIVAALALLNHVPVTFRPFRPKGQLLTHSQMKPFMASSVVTVQVPNPRRALKFVDEQIKSAHHHSRHRRHEVRGHWRYSDKEHSEKWERAFDPERKRFRYRLWIAHHERGDAALGFVRQFYSVEGEQHAA